MNYYFSPYCRCLKLLTDYLRKRFLNKKWLCDHQIKQRQKVKDQNLSWMWVILISLNSYCHETLHEVKKLIFTHWLKCQLDRWNGYQSRQLNMSIINTILWSKFANSSLPNASSTTTNSLNNPNLNRQNQSPKAYFSLSNPAGHVSPSSIPTNPTF